METRANYVTVGFFTLLVMLAAFGFVYWEAGLSQKYDTADLQIRIPGSASGLARGSAVLFNGVRVGDITRVFLDPGNPQLAIAQAVVDRRTPIKRSTKADVSITGLAGAANIDLRGGDPGEPNLIDEAEKKGAIAVITANPSAFADLLETSREFLSRADEAVTDLRDIVKEVRKPLVETAENARTFSKALADNADRVDELLSSVGSLSKTLNGVSDRLDSALGAAENLIDAVDRDKVKTIVANVEAFTKRLDDSTQGLKGIMGDVARAADKIAVLGENAGGTLERIDKVVAAVSPDDVSAAITNFKNASSDVAGVTARINKRSDDIDQFITDARELAGRLNQSSVRLDGVLAKVDGLIGSAGDNGLIAEVRDTVRSFRNVAETLNGRLATITDGLARFSGPGLRDVEALVRDSRRSIGRIEEAITSLERNPQRIITGGAGEVRSYDGRVRR